LPVQEHDVTDPVCAQEIARCKIQVHSVPTFIVDGKVSIGMKSKEEFRRIISEFKIN